MNNNLDRHSPDANHPGFAVTGRVSVGQALNPRRARLIERGKRKRTHDPIWLQELRAK